MVQRSRLSRGKRLGCIQQGWCEGRRWSTMCPASLPVHCNLMVARQCVCPYAMPRWSEEQVPTQLTAPQYRCQTADSDSMLYCCRWRGWSFAAVAQLLTSTSVGCNALPCLWRPPRAPLEHCLEGARCQSAGKSGKSAKPVSVTFQPLSRVLESREVAAVKWRAPGCGALHSLYPKP